MSGSPEVATYNIAEAVHKAVGGKVSLDGLLAVWYSIGMVVHSQLSVRKGVKLAGFGTFSLAAGIEPIFILSNEFMNKYKLKQRSMGKSDNIPLTTLNYVQLLNELTTGDKGANVDGHLTREMVEKIYKKYLSCLGSYLIEGRSVVLSIHKVCEFVISNGEFICTFQSDFLSAFGVGGKKAVNGDLVKGQKKAQLMPPQPPPRARDPITGDRGSEHSYKPPPPRARNPMAEGDEPPRPMSARSGVSSCDTMSLLHSPRSNHSSSIGGGAVRGNSNLRRENLESHTSKLANANNARQHSFGASNVNAAGDARGVAAKALFNVTDTVETIRRKIVERGGVAGIKGFQRLIKIMDNNGDKRLNKDELFYGLRDYGVSLTPTEIEQVFLYFDRDKNGFIDVTEFLVAIRGELSERRKKMIRMAFDILDTDKSGVITIEEIANVYDVSWNPDVRSGKKTTQEALREFLSHWDRGDMDGSVTLDEFTDYYRDISASIDGDDYFELMIRNAWRIPGGEGFAANTANKRVLVTNRDDTQRVETIQNELGMKPGDREAIRARLAQQGVKDVEVEMYGGVDNTTKPTNNQRPTLSTERPPARAGGAVDFNKVKSSPVVSKSAANKAFPTKVTPVAAVSIAFSPLDALRKLVYDPPCSFEQLGSKLAVSVAGPVPRVAQGAFVSRVGTLDSTLSRANLLSIWKNVDVTNAGVVELGTIHNILATKYGKDSGSTKNSGVIERVVAKILERCAGQGGIKGLQRTLAIMDDNGDKKLTKDELKFGLQDYGIEMNIREMDDIFTYFDRDRNGFIDITEFFVGIKGDLNEKRQKLVRLAFDILDRDRSGVVTLDELLEVYDVTKAPDVVSGKKTAREAIKEFSAHWDRENHDGQITFEEFLDYYKEISASIDGDDYFELMIRNAWRIPGGEGFAANTANKRVLVTNRDGTQRVETIQNELGMKPGDREAIRARLAQQGVKDVEVEMYGGVDNTTKPTNNQRPPGRISGRSNTQAPSPKKVGPPTSLQSNRNTFERHAAALKLAAAFRGRLARKQALVEKRKKDASDREKKEIDDETNRVKPKNIIRPKGKSYIGF